MKNLVIGQSGGPTAVINASLYGAVKAFRESGADGHVLGMINGIEGFLADHVMDLSTDLSDKELEPEEPKLWEYWAKPQFKT